MTSECPYSPEQIETAIAGFETADPSDDEFPWAIVADVQLAREAVRGMKLSKPLTPGAEWFMEGMIRRHEQGQPFP